MPPFDYEGSDEDDDAYDLRDVSSDVEIDPEEMDVMSDEDDTQCVLTIPSHSRMMC